MDDAHRADRAERPVVGEIADEQGRQPQRHGRRARGDRTEGRAQRGAGCGEAVATARKASSAAALCYGLGAERTAMLPGWFGDFLLSADDVITALPRAEEALRLSSMRRGEVLSRITSWMTAMGDAPDFNAAELVDAPLQVLRFAAETGSGAAAFSRWH